MKNDDIITYEFQAEQSAVEIKEVAETREFFESTETPSAGAGGRFFEEDEDDAETTPPAST